MPQGRSVEDELLTSMITLHYEKQGDSWTAGDLIPVFQRLTGIEAPLLSVSRTVRRFVKYGWVQAEPTRDGRPGRPSMTYRFAADGLAQAQRAAARLFGAGQSWAREPLSLALTATPPA
jgi:DNA-binding transcriptional regulator PaaX